MSRVLLRGWISAYSFQVLNTVDLIESAHNLAFDVADQCHPFNRCLSNPACARSCPKLIAGSRNRSSWFSAFPSKTSSAETQPKAQAVDVLSVSLGIQEWTVITFDTG